VPKVTEDRRFRELRRLAEELRREYGLSSDELARHISRADIPVSIFKADCTPFETIVKYLKENRRVSLALAARLLNRTRQGVGQAYARAQKRCPQALAEEPGHRIPLEVVASRRYPVLASIVKHLKDQGLSYSAIGRLLNRDPRTVWSAYQRTRT
jgi:hypothetical protein